MAQNIDVHIPGGIPMLEDIFQGNVSTSEYVWNAFTLEQIRYDNSSCSVCVHVCYQASWYIPHTLFGSPKCGVIRFLMHVWHSKCMICVNFTKYVLFASFGIIC